MQVSIINTNKSSLSLVYNIATHELTGDKVFSVSLFVVDEPLDDYKVYYNAYSFFNFTPPVFIEVEDRPRLVTISIDDSEFDLTPGDYEYSLILTNLTSEEKNIPIYLKVVNEGGGTVDPPVEYKLKYYLENKPSNDLYVCEIHENQYTGDPIKIEGRCEIKYQDKPDHFQPIIASSLRLNLMADESISLQDLYSEDEKNFKVFLKRNDQIIFTGFLKPDGIFEDYVYDRWELSIDAFDGLSTLKNMSFSSENGISFSGRYKASDIIVSCLKKSGLDLPINVNCAVYYEGTPGSYNAFETFYLNTERYYQNGSDPMDCESVLKSILQLFNTSLFQHNGEWYINRSIDLIPNTVFNKYVDGIYNTTFSVYPAIEIGSHIDNFNVFHCNANQKKSIAASVQAYRVTYQYGNANSIFRNGELKLSGGGLDIDGWIVVNDDGKVERLPNGFGLTSKTFTGNGDSFLLKLNQTIDINGGAVIKLIIRFANENTNSVGLRFSIAVGGQYFNIETGGWQGSGYINFVANYSFEGYYPGGEKECKGLGDATYELVVQAPTSGTLELNIFRDKHPLGAGDFKLYSVQVVPNDSGNIKGREYTASRTKKISTVTKPNITLYNGDSVSDLFVGTIYKIDADTPTSKWYRLDEPGAGSTFKELLEINAEDNLRLSPRPMMIFEGDVYGYIPFISLISIENIPGKKFQPSAYSFDTSTGILKLSSKEFSSDYLDAKDFNVEVKDNYGNETKVTIV